MYIICNKSICVQAVCAVDLDHKKAVCQTWEAKSGVQGAEAAVQGAGGQLVAGVEESRRQEAGGRRSRRRHEPLHLFPQLVAFSRRTAGH